MGDVNNWTSGLPSSTNTAVFDKTFGGNSNSPVTINNTIFPIDTLIELKNGYTQTITIADGVTASIGVQDDNPTTDSFNVQYSSSNTTLAFSRNTTLYNFNITNSPGFFTLARSGLIVGRP